MNKFKKAINELNKPIEESNKAKKKAEKAAAKSADKEAAKKAAETKDNNTEVESAKAEIAEVEAAEAEKVETNTLESDEADAVETDTVGALENDAAESIEAEPVETDTVEAEPVEADTVESIEAETEETEAEDITSEIIAESPASEDAEGQDPAPAADDNIKSDKQAKKEKKANAKKAKKESKNEKKENKKAKKEAKKQSKKVKGGKKGKVLTIVIAALVVLVLVGGAANYNLNNQLRPTFYQIQSNKVVDNVRVVAIADLHLKEFGKNNTKLVEKIESYHPDIIAIVGDMNMESNPDYSIVLNLCARLNDIAPVYYSLGNHEIDAMLFNDSQIYYDLDALGVNIMNNESATVEIGLSTIDIIGLTQGPENFREYGKKFFDTAMSATDNFKLVLTHYPENFDGYLEDYSIDLALCGHAHGGLVRLPLIGGLYAADQGLFPKLCDGYHEIGNSNVIITRGLGRSGVVPRINNAPEISVIDINWY